ncbi:MAG: DNA-directed RNA polymerase subunit omega [Candidatus Cloacimonetes bacterium]|nr:DNA-directed RNA polymerase subunit omega [Candidatus Cloacimonadota bacterium]
MIDFNIDTLQKSLDGKFNVAHLIINRVKKLKTGVESKVNRRMREKDIVLAIREIDSTELEYTLDESSTRERQVELAEAVLEDRGDRS